jgi:mono/diheme cytochrome c family protein
MPPFSFYYEENAQGSAEPKREIDDLIAYVQSLGGHAGVERAERQAALKEKLMTERGKGNEEIIHEWFPTTWRTVQNPMEPTERSLIHGKQIFTTNCVGCHGLKGDGKGPAARFINYPAPRNFTDVSAQLMFSDGEMYDAILFGIDGTAMPAWGDIITVNDIWDVTNFLRTIPNGGLLTDELDASMMVSPPDVKPIEATPIATALATPEGGQGQNTSETPAPGQTTTEPSRTTGPQESTPSPQP